MFRRSGSSVASSNLESGIAIHNNSKHSNNNNKNHSTNDDGDDHYSPKMKPSSKSSPHNNHILLSKKLFRNPLFWVTCLVLLAAYAGMVMLLFRHLDVSPHQYFYPTHNHHHRHQHQHSNSHSKSRDYHQHHHEKSHSDQVEKKTSSFTSRHETTRTAQLNDAHSTARLVDSTNKEQQQNINININRNINNALPQKEKVAATTTTNDDGDDTVDAIIVGTGLAGLSAALTILDRGGRVVLLEKEPRVGGNSNKASSGINACCTKQQKEKQLKSSQQQWAAHQFPTILESERDTLDLFRKDTIRSAGTSAQFPLIDTLVNHSADAVNWLQSRVQADLSQVAQLGGHSRPRTHRPLEGMVGATIIYQMMQAIQEYNNNHNNNEQQQPPQVRILTDSTVTRLLTTTSKDGQLSVIGVEYSTTTTTTTTTLVQQELFAPHVVLATGGFAADRSPHSWLAQYRPELLGFPTTAGLFSTGDGINLATAAVAAKQADPSMLVDMDKIQLHPTGFVDPADPHSGSKTLAAELLRGVGGLLLDSRGRRFCNEMGTRDYVTKQMLQQQQRSAGYSKQQDQNNNTLFWDPKNTVPTFWLVLSSQAANEANKHVDWYMQKGLLTKVEGGTLGLAKYLHQYSDTENNNNNDQSVLSLQKSIVETFQEYHRAADQSQPQLQDPFGKTTFRNLPEITSDQEVFHVGKVTPVLHYCMGGLAIDTKGNVLLSTNSNNKNSKQQQQTIIPGLHAAGEVTGGVHGVNRLGGNSLLECAVYGSIVGHEIPIRKHKHTKTYAQRQQEQQSLNKRGPVVTQDLRSISLEELALHNREGDCWLAAHGMVYDLSDFAKQHPGGPYILYGLAGKDATKTFATVHHASLLDSFESVRVGKLIGPIPEEELPELTLKEIAANHKKPNDCWVAIDGIVYDMTKFAKHSHPGGSWVIYALCGKDGTEDFFNRHTIKYLDRLQGNRVGKIKKQSVVVLSAFDNNNNNDQRVEISGDSTTTANKRREEDENHLLLRHHDILS